MKSKNIPRLRFPEFRNAPEWDEKSLNQVCEVNPSAKNLPKIFVYIDLESVESGMLLQKKMINLVDAPSRAQRLLQNGDIIFQMVRPYQKNNYFFDIQDGYKYVASTGYAQLRAYQSNRFLFHYLHTNKFVDDVLIKCTGSNYPAINSNDLSSISLNIPKPDEQQKIADCLTSLDDLIAAQSVKAEALKKQKKALMQQLFPCEGESVPRLRFPEFRDAPEWEEKEVGEVFKVTRGEVLSMLLVQEKQSEEKPYPVYSSQTKNNGLAGFYSYFLYENAITWTTDGANAGDVNYREGKFYCTNVCGVLLNENGYANPCIAALINSVSRKHVSYVGNPKLMNGVMSKIKIPFPSVDEQLKISNLLFSIDELIIAQNIKVETLNEHKKGLMQQLFPSDKGI